MEIICESNAAAGHRERTGKDDLPHNEKGKPPAGAFRPECLPQIVIAASRFWHSGAKFRPNESIAQRKQRSQEPADHCLRAAHRGKEQGDRDEGADPNHVCDVERCRLGQTEVAMEMGVLLRFVAGADLGLRSNQG